MPMMPCIVREHTGVCRYIYLLPGTGPNMVGILLMNLCLAS